jgi:hypothetical protein
MAAKRHVQFRWFPFFERRENAPWPRAEHMSSVCSVVRARSSVSLIVSAFRASRVLAQHQLATVPGFNPDSQGNGPITLAMHGITGSPTNPAGWASR